MNNHSKKLPVFKTDVKSPFVIIALLYTAIIFFSSCKNNSLNIENQFNEGPVIYGLEQLEQLEKSGLSMAVGSKKIATAIDPDLAAEAYSIINTENVITVSGGDPAGVMYGLLELKDMISAGKEIKEDLHGAPRFAFRAIKFNLPWDSYRNGKALQLHYETSRDTLFWEAFLDMMAENRFNKLTLWNLHPFNYLVKTEKYPEACGFSDNEMAEWKNFWTALFRMAKNRGVETYLVNWNIFASPEFAEAHGVAEYCIENKYFVDVGDTSEIIRDYTREVVREVIDQYPDLTGLGITLGEGMGGMTADEREEWLLESYIEGMRQASRKIKFIHRVPLSAGKWSGGTTSSYVEKMTRRTLDTLSCIIPPINIELKFNWSHGHSCTELVKVHGGKLTDAYWNPPPTNYKLAWMMRNEDFFVLRWGQPDFIRDHIAENGKPWVNGYFVGSECYIPAKNYITSISGTSFDYAFERQWMFYKNWGRLLYDPDESDQVFVNEFEERYPGWGSLLFENQVLVSRVPLIIASYWNATWDNTLYSEGFLSIMGRDSVKLISLEDMRKKKPMDPDFLSIREYLDGGETADPGKITPLELADSMHLFCSRALEAINEVELNGDPDLRCEVSDIQAWAHLGRYFSSKLRAAVDYQKYLDTGKKENLESSIAHLEAATSSWRRLSEVTSEIYDPMPMQHYERNGDIPFHWSIVEEEVREELEWLTSQQ